MRGALAALLLLLAVAFTRAAVITTFSDAACTLSATPYTLFSDACATLGGYSAAAARSCWRCLTTAWLRWAPAQC